MRALISFAVLALLSGPASAGCSCNCVNGHVQALCSSSLDIQPICPPRICPLDAPAIAPIQAPVIPPIGTSSCRQARVLNTFTGQYQFQTVCN